MSGVDELLKRVPSIVGGVTKSVAPQIIFDEAAAIAAASTAARTAALGLGTFFSFVAYDLEHPQSVADATLVNRATELTARFFEERGYRAQYPVDGSIVVTTADGAAFAQIDPRGGVTRLHPMNAINDVAGTLMTTGLSGLTNALNPEPVPRDTPANRDFATSPDSINEISRSIVQKLSALEVYRSIHPGMEPTQAQITAMGSAFNVWMNANGYNDIAEALRYVLKHPESSARVNDIALTEFTTQRQEFKDIFPSIPAEKIPPVVQNLWIARKSGLTFGEYTDSILAANGKGEPRDPQLRVTLAGLLRPKTPDIGATTAAPIPPAPWHTPGYPKLPDDANKHRNPPERYIDNPLLEPSKAPAPTKPPEQDPADPSTVPRKTDSGGNSLTSLVDAKIGVPPPIPVAPNLSTPGRSTTPEPTTLSAPAAPPRPPNPPTVTAGGFDDLEAQLRQQMREAQKLTQETLNSKESEFRETRGTQARADAEALRLAQAKGATVAVAATALAGVCHTLVTAAKASDYYKQLWAPGPDAVKAFEPGKSADSLIKELASDKAAFFNKYYGGKDGGAALQLGVVRQVNGTDTIKVAVPNNLYEKLLAEQQAKGMKLAYGEPLVVKMPLLNGKLQADVQVVPPPYDLKKAGLISDVTAQYIKTENGGYSRVNFGPEPGQIEAQIRLFEPTTIEPRMSRVSLDLTSVLTGKPMAPGALKIGDMSAKEWIHARTSLALATGMPGQIVYGLSANQRVYESGERHVSSTYLNLINAGTLLTKNSALPSRTNPLGQDLAARVFGDLAELGTFYGVTPPASVPLSFGAQLDVKMPPTRALWTETGFAFFAVGPNMDTVIQPHKGFDPTKLFAAAPLDVGLHVVAIANTAKISPAPQVAPISGQMPTSVTNFWSPKSNPVDPVNNSETGFDRWVREKAPEVLGSIVSREQRVLNEPPLIAGVSMTAGTLPSFRLPDPPLPPTTRTGISEVQTTTPTTVAPTTAVLTPRVPEIQPIDVARLVFGKDPAALHISLSGATKVPPITKTPDGDFSQVFKTKDNELVRAITDKSGTTTIEAVMNANLSFRAAPDLAPALAKNGFSPPK